jgi:hypothetical protein
MATCGKRSGWTPQPARRTDLLDADANHDHQPHGRFMGDQRRAHRLGEMSTLPSPGHLWKAIIHNDGQESACGWCQDKWGLSWQFTPRALTAALTEPDDEAVKRASWWSGFGGGEGAIRIPNWSGPGALGNLDLINSAVDAYTAQVRAVCP